MAPWRGLSSDVTFAEAPTPSPAEPRPSSLSILFLPGWLAQAAIVDLSTGLSHVPANWNINTLEDSSLVPLFDPSARDSPWCALLALSNYL